MCIWTRPVFGSHCMQQFSNLVMTLSVAPTSICGNDVQRECYGALHLVNHTRPHHRHHRQFPSNLSKRAIAALAVRLTTSPDLRLPDSVASNDHRIRSPATFLHRYPTHPPASFAIRDRTDSDRHIVSPRTFIYIQLLHHSASLVLAHLYPLLVRFPPVPSIILEYRTIRILLHGLLFHFHTFGKVF